eukprot:1156326-Pelagomonas_calceolata.AAC.11
MKPYLAEMNAHILAGKRNVLKGMRTCSLCNNTHLASRCILTLHVIIPTIQQILWQLSKHHAPPITHLPASPADLACYIAPFLSSMYSSSAVAQF